MCLSGSSCVSVRAVLAQRGSEHAIVYKLEELASLKADLERDMGLAGINGQGNKSAVRHSDQQPDLGEAVPPLQVCNSFVTKFVICA